VVLEVLGNHQFHVGSLCVALLVLEFHPKVERLLGLGVGVALGIALVMSIALFLDAVNLSMSWFSQNWMLFGLYFCPMIFGMGIVPAIYFSRTKEVGLDKACYLTDI